MDQFHETRCLDDAWIRDEPVRFWDRSGPGYGSIFPLFQHGEIGQLQTLNRMVLKEWSMNGREFFYKGRP